MPVSEPVLPAVFKPVAHYLKIAIEHEQRNPIVSYYCRLHALENAMKLDKKSPEAKAYLVYLMDLLESVKKANPDSEEVHSNEVGQAYMEDYAMKIFLHADNQDRAGNFNRGVVKSFYTSSIIFDVLGVFGELNEEFEKHRKYAKWKAAYINRCLKTGETPHAGPLDEGPDDAQDPGSLSGNTGAIDGGAPYPQPGAPPGGGIGFDNFPVVPDGFGATGGSNAPPPHGGSTSNYTPPPSTNYPPPRPNQPPRNVAPQGPPPPVHPPQPAAAAQPIPQSYQPAAGVKLTQEQIQAAMKLCKYANSALMYEDTITAIDNLTKCLNLLTTGQDQ